MGDAFSMVNIPFPEAGFVSLFCVTIIKSLDLANFMKKSICSGSQFWSSKAKHPHLDPSPYLSQDTIGVTTAKDKESMCSSVCSNLSVSFCKYVHANHQSTPDDFREC